MFDSHSTIFFCIASLLSRDPATNVNSGRPWDGFAGFRILTERGITLLLKDLLHFALNARRVDCWGGS